jgi:predicted SAM-dependent methyltransferase
MRGHDPLAAHLAYPIPPPSKPRLADRIALRPRRDGRPKRFGPIRCTVCGGRATADDFADIPSGLRETGRCSKCSATNRHRQLAFVLAGRASEMVGRRLRSAADVARTDLRIHNTESAGPVHRQLAASRHYTASEYFGPGHRSGDQIDGVMHQDLMALSFADESIDALITSDVFEHVADPYLAHREVFRVLRPGGFHVFTIPFLETRYLDERRAHLDDRGQVVHLAEPVYHADPINPVPGALVFNYFSVEMLVRLAEIGFATEMYWLHRPRAGIVGQEATVFAARKPPA